MAYDYYDESYFQSGASKGTVYSDYIQQSRSSAIYREIALAVAEVFRPKRTLEIGCATGVVVKHLNDIGIEAHGVDVSAWAIEHREHENVTLSGVENLPFPDGYFDVTYSVHSLEHVPPEHKDAAFAELARVTRGAQFHMLPMIGLGPYTGDPALVIQGLRRDPTHHLLEQKSWWVEQFARTGFHEHQVAVTFRHETGQLDLGVSQVALWRDQPDEAIKSRARGWNENVLREWVRRTEQLKTGLAAKLGPHDEVQHRALVLSGEWGDAELDTSDGASISERLYVATVAVRADNPVALRFCFIHADGAERDLWREYPPGVTVFVFSGESMQVRKPGDPEAPVVRIVFGGPGRASVDVMLACAALPARLLMG